MYHFIKLEMLNPAFVEHKPHGENLEAGFYTENHEKIRLCFFEKVSPLGFVIIGQVVFQRQHHAVRQNCQDNQILKNVQKDCHMVKNDSIINRGAFIPIFIT